MKMRQKSFKTMVVTTLTIFMLSVLTSTGLASPAGPPARPSAGPAPDGSLAVHNLTYAPSALGQPAKGIAPYFFAGSDYTSTYPGGLMWSYFALSDIMTSPTDCNFFDWTILEKMLDESAVWGRQGVIRFYTEYPGQSKGIPPCLTGKETNRTNGYWGTQSPDYDDPDTIQAFTNFINAFAAKYDGDPRIAYITMGLVGLWGEWHTWPYDQDLADGYPNLFPTDATVCAIVHAYDAAFSRTQLEIRYGELACAAGANIGFHDDSWPYMEFRSGQGGGTAHGMTLPVSMGGWSDAFLQRLLNPGAENQWIGQSIGGEARPEIQSSLYSNWPNGAGQVDNVLAATELTHITWMINQTGTGGYSQTDPNVSAGMRKMGYNLHVPTAYFNSSVSGNFKVGVKIQNDGVAPFYYPWTVQVGLKDGSGNIIQTWNTTWDITKVQPLQIRAFPDWNVGADPTYLNFGYPMYYETTISAAGVASGNYTVVMHVRNPLEDVTIPVLQARPPETRLTDYVISHWRPAVALKFANAEQNVNDGWLSLGSISVTGGGPTWTPGPTNTPTKTNTPGAPTNTPTNTFTPGAATNTPTRTATPVPPTNINTPVSPTNTPVGQTSYEAEAAGNTLAGGAVVSACGPCSGGNKVGYVGNNAGTLQYNGVSAASTGNYTLTMFYANGDTVARNVTVSVNGGTGVNISFPVTGGWTTVGSVQTTISLNSGSSNTIKFSNATGWAPDFDRITLNTSGGPTNTPVPATATSTRTNTPAGSTATPTKTNTPLPPTNTPTKTNTPTGPTNTPIPPTATPTAGAALTIDSFIDSNKWSVQHLNDLNKAVSWVMDSIYYGTLPPGEIVMNSSPAGQYYQETITQTLAGRTNLVLRLRDWSDTDTENHWNIVLNDGTDHTVSLNTYGNVTGAYTNINIPLSAFGANLANVQYVRLVHKDATYAVIMIDLVTAQ